MPTLPDTLLERAAAVAGLGGSATTFAALDGDELTRAASAIAELRHCVDQFAALAAGEIAHRSRQELGHRGLAQQAGFLNPIAMIQAVAHVSRHDATRLVEAGTMIAEAEFAEAVFVSAAADAGAAGADGAASRVLSWRERLAAAVTEGALSLDAMDAIRRVLCEVTSCDDDTLNAVADELVDAARGLTPDQVHRRARQARDIIDAEGIARREKEQRDLRSVRTWWDATGMHRGSWRLAPEDGALVAEAFAQILSPRRGGPRFVDPAARATAEDLLNDDRTDEQVAADAFVDTVRLAVDADPGTLFGVRRPCVRVVVTADRLEKRTGPGHLEGRNDAVSTPTIERTICNTGVISVGFDSDGQCVNVGRDRRLFTERQRIGLAVRDGGCRFPGCDRPPSYCEAHHINPWASGNGRTDVADGILLCRRHHLLIHDNHWEVRRDRADYLLVPPRSVDPTQNPIPLPSRSPAMGDLARQPAPARA
ncbi:DUF222 domain-containing protein [Marisediminicola sp. LYQ134]|uniref:HNH endonuclease signature motif containing protein n=1 Tax=Marisediminicola sp. LYQ134 TaxID=3391061 RepID=UPI0039832E2D